MAKYVQSLAKQELTQRFTKGQNKMYEVTSNQKEQLLNQVLNTLTNTTAVTAVVHRLLKKQAAELHALCKTCRSELEGMRPLLGLP